MSTTIKSLMWTTTVACTGKKNTDKAGCDGQFFGWVSVDGRRWAIVQWEHDEDPDLYKANHLLIAENRMVELEP